MNISRFEEWLLSNNWEKNELSINESYEDLFEKYPFIEGNAFIEFLLNYTYCSRRDDMVWFNCHNECVNSSMTEFPLDFFRNLSLDCANDFLEKSNIESFWKNHFPFLVSLQNGYEYFSISRDGRIYNGFEPEFEDPLLVADNIDDFIEMLIEGKFSI